MVGVYKITNTVNGKVYIGESLHIEHRWEEHKELLKNGTHHSKKLQEDYNTYGINNFEFEVLEEIDDNLKPIIEKCILVINEDKYIKKYNSINQGYNTEETLKLILNGEKPLFKDGRPINKREPYILKSILKNMKENKGLYISPIDKDKKDKVTNEPKLNRLDRLKRIYNNTENIKLVYEICKNYIFENEYESISKIFEENGFNRKNVYQILRDINILVKNNNIKGNICAIKDLSMFNNQEKILIDEIGNIVDKYNVPYMTKKGFKYLLDKVIDYAKNNNINIFSKKFIEDNLMTS